MSDNPKLKALGSGDTLYRYDAPDPELLETFSSPFPHSRNMQSHRSNEIFIKVPEFTSLCPITGQPDFATIIIVYEPRELCVESKSLKLYMGSFRNHGQFHESCVNQIAEDLNQLLNPHRLSVEGQFTPRGGIPFWPKVIIINDSSVG